MHRSTSRGVTFVESIAVIASLFVGITAFVALGYGLESALVGGTGGAVDASVARAATRPSDPATGAYLSGGTAVVAGAQAAGSAPSDGVEGGNGGGAANASGAGKGGGADAAKIAGKISEANGNLSERWALDAKELAAITDGPAVPNESDYHAADFASVMEAYASYADALGEVETTHSEMADVAADVADAPEGHSFWSRVKSWFGGDLEPTKGDLKDKLTSLDEARSEALARLRSVREQLDESLFGAHINARDLRVGLARMGAAQRLDGIASRMAGRWWSPMAGVRQYRQESHEGIGGQVINAVFIDLCAPGVRVSGADPSGIMRNVSQHAAAAGADIAINANFFQPGSGLPTYGMAITNGQVWGSNVDEGNLIGFGENRAGIQPGKDGPQPWMQHAVSGHPTILLDGHRVDQHPNEGVRGSLGNRIQTDSMCTNRHPRSLAGFSADGTQMILVTVDGRGPGRAGMTCAEAADLMKSLGAHSAANLDGGGSASLHVGGQGVVNRPSDGRPRPVVNTINVHVSSGGQGATAAGSGDATGAGTAVGGDGVSGHGGAASNAGKPGVDEPASNGSSANSPATNNGISSAGQAAQFGAHCGVM